MRWVGWSPVLWLFVIEIALVLVLIPLMLYLRPSSLTATFLLFIVAVYAFYFWIAFYSYVEFALWRRTRNLGHLYQFLGSLLIVLPILWSYVPFLLGLPTLTFGLVSTLVQALTSAAGTTGLIMALYGYYHKPFHARDVDLYRNVVVRVGERLDVLTDGYSTRVFETRYEGLPPDALRQAAEPYAIRFQTSGFLLGHRLDDRGITLVPVAYAGLGTFRWANALRHLYRLARQPERLTWVRIEWGGLVQVHISPEDYARIRRPVAHHLLCTAVADAVVGSFLAYANGNEPAAVASLLGPERLQSSDQLKLPGRAERRDARLLVGFAAFLLVAGASMTGFSVLAAASPYAWSNVHWDPNPPVAGQTIRVYATLTSLQELPFGESPLLYWWVYFGSANRIFPPPSGAATFTPSQGNEYVATLGPFDNGTEVTFLASLEVQGTLTTRLIQSAPYAVDIGTVIRGGVSGLSISDPRLDGPPGASVSTLSVWINSTAAISLAQVLVAWSFACSFANGGGSSSAQPSVFNLTGTGGYYSRSFYPGIFAPTQCTHLTGTLDFKFVTQDATGDTAVSTFTILQVDERA